MNRTRTLVALIAISMIGSGCCLMHTRKDTGEAYVLPVRQWSWMEWGCALLIGCIAYVINDSHTSGEQLSRAPCAMNMRVPDC